MPPPPPLASRFPASLLRLGSLGPLDKSKAFGAWSQFATFRFRRARVKALSPDEANIRGSVGASCASAFTGRLKKGEFAEAIGRSRGGRTSKIHALADDCGRPVAFALTPGNVADISMAAPLLAAVARPKRLLAEKAYDADSLREWLKQTKVKAVDPSTASRRTPYPLDNRAYKRRNLIERMFCKLKNWRRIATRYDRHAQNYLSGLALAAIMIAWI
jgi:transposase